MLRPLGYPKDGLEPVISDEKLFYHHDIHHQFIVNNLNDLMENFDRVVYKYEHSDILYKVKITNLKNEIILKGNDHINHEFFWETLAPISEGGGVEPDSDSDLGKAINKAFGSIENMIDELSAISKGGVIGSDCAALAYNKKTGNLEIKTSYKYDLLQVKSNDLIPLLSTDIWVSSSYLYYEELEPTFIDNMWKIVNWDVVSERFNDA